jgi:hypothetical protein
MTIKKVHRHGCALFTRITISFFSKKNPPYQNALKKQPKIGKKNGKKTRLCHFCAPVLKNYAVKIMQSTFSPARTPLTESVTKQNSQDFPSGFQKWTSSDPCPFFESGPTFFLRKNKFYRK